MNDMRKKLHISDMTMMALYISILCVASLIVFPLPFTPVVLSLHTVIINLIGLTMRPRNAFLTVLIYLLMGAVGLPVFAGMTAGPDKLFGPTGGFYFGFLFSATLVSIVKGEGKAFGRNLAASLLVGLPIQHILAVLFMCFYNGFHIVSAVLSVSMPFLLGDVIKCVLSSFIAIPILKTMPKLSVYRR